LANWLTTDHTTCLHDAWRYAKTATELRELLLNLDTLDTQRYLGTADSLNGWRYEELRAEFPTARFLLIERPIEDAISSTLKLSFSPGLEHLSQLLLTLHEAHEQVKLGGIRRVNFEDLDSEETIRGIQNYLTPELAFNTARLKMLNQLRVIIHEDKYLEDLHEEFKVKLPS